MTRFARLLSAALAVSAVAALGASPANKPVTPFHKITFTPVKYPEIADAFPMGYLNAEGQAVYFPDGRLPADPDLYQIVAG